MNEKEPSLVTSTWSRRVTQDGISVEVEIYRLESNNDWILEVVNSNGTSIVWDDPFPSDDDANQAFLNTVEEDGMSSFLDSAKVIPLRR